MPGKMAYLLVALQLSFVTIVAGCLEFPEIEDEETEVEENENHEDDALIEELLDEDNETESHKDNSEKEDEKATSQYNITFFEGVPSVVWNQYDNGTGKLIFSLNATLRVRAVEKNITLEYKITNNGEENAIQWMANTVDTHYAFRIYNESGNLTFAEGLLWKVALAAMDGWFIPAKGNVTYTTSWTNVTPGRYLVKAWQRGTPYLHVYQPIGVNDSRDWGYLNFSTTKTSYKLGENATINPKSSYPQGSFTIQKWNGSSWEIKTETIGDYMFNNWNESYWKVTNRNSHPTSLQGKYRAIQFANNNLGLSYFEVAKKVECTPGSGH